MPPIARNRIPCRIGRKRPSTPNTMKIQPEDRIAMRANQERCGLPVSEGSCASTLWGGLSDMDRPAVDGERRLLYRLIQGWVAVAHAGHIFCGTTELDNRYDLVD